jgi:hypothetical protein
MPRRIARRTALLAALLGLPACGGDSGDGGGAVMDAAAGDSGITFIPCTDDPRVDHYSAGMEKAGAMGKLKMKLLSSEPAPPAQPLDVWTVEITDPAGAPQSDLTLVASPYMPDHRHAPPVPPLVSALPEPGRYRIERINLFMAGVWQVKLNATSASNPALSDAAIFLFCVER